MRRFFASLLPSMLLTLVTTCVAPVYAAYGNQSKNKSAQLSRTEDANAPTIIQSEQLTGRKSRDLYMDYEVEIERDKTLITGDHGIFRQEENEADVVGNVFLQRFDDQYTADRTQLNLDTGEGVLTHPTYKFAANNGQGKANRIDLTSEDTTDIFKGTYSTCEGTSPDWYLKSQKLHIDNARNSGYATSPVLYFKDVPIMAAPAMIFPVNGERKSGVLPPTVAYGSEKGLELLVPYYFNLAPNYDLTLFPSLLSKRGVQLGAEVRYLGENYSGKTYLEYMPEDKDADRSNRYFINSQHTQTFNNGFSYYWNYKNASDDDYVDDFSGPMSRDVDRQLWQEGGITQKFGDIWTARLRATNYKILQDHYSPIERPFSRLPELTLKGGQSDINNFDWNVYAEWTRFWLNDSEIAKLPSVKRARGNRFVINADMSYPMFGGGYFLTPKAIINMTKYDLDDLDYLSPYHTTSLTRTLPTFSLDGGLIFERNASEWGEGMTQTLEPRLFYVYTPYKDQSNYPIFDTGEPSFGYGYLFMENAFGGYDRISDAHNITAALTTRLIRKDGLEWMRFTAGQRYYLRDQKVFLYNTSKREKQRSHSDWLFLANGYLNKALTFDSLLEYNQDEGRAYKGNFNLQWKPGPMKLLNAGYRYLRNTVDYYGEPINQFSLSGQWPLGGRWYGVGQIAYSVPESRTIEDILGIEYNADCWIFRLITQRYQTSSVKSNNALYFQLELKGLSSLGSNPIDAMSKGINGYEPLSAQ